MEKEDCSICFSQYDKIRTVPRVLRCGHTFCQICLDKIKNSDLHHSIMCPNCRVLTENVMCTKNLPENESVFQKQPTPFAMNSPYEAAKRLLKEAQSLINTNERFNDYLSKLEEHD